jgi:hypothetical protein
MFGRILKRSNGIAKNDLDDSAENELRLGNFTMKLFLLLLACAGLCGCDALEDNGVHMAMCLKDGAKKLEHSNDTELVIRYEPLTGIRQSYDVEFVPDSLILVTGTNGGTSTYHLNYVHVGQRFDLKKTNEATFVTLRKVDGRIDVVDVR